MSEAEVLRQSAAEVLQAIERHCGLVRSLKEGGAARVAPCRWRDCPHRRKLRETVGETVAILEQTRKAFKSKQLETLRKKLLGVLADDA